MKIGIYGGSFNPPHLGHLHAAASAAKHLALEQLLLIPAGIPPHKQLASGAPEAEQRAEMTRLTAEQASLMSGVPTKLSRMELERAGKSYTADTLRILQEQHPNDELWLLMGTDMFLTFQDWYQPEEIVARAGICAFGRSAGDTAELFEQQRARLMAQYPNARIETMTLPDLVEISSTELRAALPEGKGARYLTPQVYGYILREHLYGTSLDLKRLTPAELRPVALSYLKASRVRHVLGVEEEAMRLAVRYDADVEKARVAALLHDCTKKLGLEEQLALCEQYGVELDDLERVSLKLLHAKTGAAIARDVFGADEEVCSAILWHTTGRPNMTTLEKVIYLADYIEPNRDFDGVDELRRAVYDDLDRGLELGLRMSVEELMERGSPVHHDTREAWEYIRAELGEAHGV